MGDSFGLGWKGYEFASREHCTISTGSSEILINGRIRSRPADIDLDIAYSIRLDIAWESTAVRIAGRFEGRPVDYDFQRSGSVWTNWDGRRLDGALEPDISFTPLTNTLPIRRLGLAPGESAEIRVLYFDIAAQTVDIRSQRYTRVDERAYRFQTIPEDFEAVLEVDAAGFVTAYPELFSRL